MAEVDTIDIPDVTPVTRTVATMSKLIKTSGLPADAASAATDTTAVTHTSLLKQLSVYLGTLAGAVSSSKVATKAASGDIADGASATLGAKADVKASTSDATPISAMSIWKQISFSIQAAAASLATLVGSLASLGPAVMTSSQSVTIATDDARVGPVNETAPATDIASSGINGRLQRIAQRLSSMFTTGLSNKAFSVAFTTLTRPANTTAYTAGDSISDNATAGSVTALTATVSDTNDDPIFINDILITSTDTGLAGKRVRAYLYNSNPTSSSGVSGGDNAAFAQKIAGYIGSFSGRMEAGFSDGTVGRLVPSFQLAADTTDTAGSPAGGFVTVLPTSGAKTVFIQFQAIDAFTPSASSTTIIARARGWQGRAA